jgi:hypothetical protein
VLPKSHPPHIPKGDGTRAGSNLQAHRDRIQAQPHFILVLVLLCVSAVYVQFVGIWCRPCSDTVFACTLNGLHRADAELACLRQGNRHQADIRKIHCLTSHAHRCSR